MSEENASTHGSPVNPPGGGDPPGGGPDLDEHEVASFLAEQGRRLEAKCDRFKQALWNEARAIGRAVLAATRYVTARDEEDPRKERGVHLPVAVSVAGVAGAFDYPASFWSAQALEWGLGDTLVVAAFLAAGVAIGGWLLAYCKHAGHRTGFRAAMAGMATLILIQGGLRFDFARIVGGHGILRALAEAVLLTLVTAMLCAIAYVALDRAEPVAHYRLRRDAEKRQQKANVAITERVSSEFDLANDVRLAEQIEGPGLRKHGELLAAYRRQIEAARELLERPRTLGALTPRKEEA